MAAQAQPLKGHGSFQRYASGERAEHQHEHKCVAAVISGRVRLKFSNETMVLRASDAATIPARARYSVEALDDCLLYRYSEPGEQDLWGV